MRILSIDYGKKRTGLAVTDPLQIIAGGLATVATAELFQYLNDYIERETVERIVIGEPRQPNGQPSENPVTYTHIRAHETKANLVCRLLLEKKKKKKKQKKKKKKKKRKKKNALITITTKHNQIHN